MKTMEKQLNNGLELSKEEMIKAIEQDNEPLKNWRKFKVLERDNKLVCSYAKKIDKYENSDSIEDINKVMEKVMASKMTKKQKEEFDKVSKIYINRVERRVGNNFGALIKRLREGNGYTLNALAEITGMSASYINRMEHGERKAPSVPVITKLAEALNVSTEELLEVAGISSGSATPGSSAVDFYKLILSNEITFGEKVQSREQVEALLEIVKIVTECDWSEKTKYVDSIKIMEAVDGYKNSSNPNAQK